MFDYKFLFSLLIAMLLISTGPVACVSNSQEKPATESSSTSSGNSQMAPVNSALEPRIVARWDALIARDFATAYEFFTPAYRKLFPLEHFLSQTGTSVRWLSVEVVDIRIDDIRAEVDVVLEYRLDLPFGEGDDFGNIARDIDEKWLWKDGQWWFTTEDNSGLL